MKLFRIAQCTVLLAAASASIGQTSPGDVVVDVPFASVVAKQALPAGPYIVRAVSDAQVRIFNSKTTGFFVPTTTVRCAR